MYNFFVFCGSVLWKEQLALALPWMFAFLLPFFFLLLQEKKILAYFNLLSDQSDTFPSLF